MQVYMYGVCRDVLAQVVDLVNVRDDRVRYHLLVLDPILAVPARKEVSAGQKQEETGAGNGCSRRALLTFWRS